MLSKKIELWVGVFVAIGIAALLMLSLKVANTGIGGGGESYQLFAKFENIGGFSFKNITKNSGVDNTGWSQAVTHTDLNNDHWQDLIVGNDFGVNAYYINQKNGRFKEV